MMDELNLLSNKLNNKEKSLDDIIKEVAEEEGMTFEETKELFKKGLREFRGYSSNLSKKNKEKKKAKRKQAKKSRKRNRK